VLVLDSSGLSKVAERSRRAAALIRALQNEGLWPPVVPTAVLAESVSGRARTDANVNRFLKSCDVHPVLPERAARRAGELRARARRGSAVDAIVVVLAEPHGTVLTSDRADIEALASRAEDVAVELA
jgi:predicted nucleic acid-binding protein